jgi:hypothetical protein
VVAVAAAVLATDWWLVAAHGLGTGLRQHLMTAAVDAVGAAVVTLSLAGSLYLVIGLARRARRRGPALVRRPSRRPSRPPPPGRPGA